MVCGRRVGVSVPFRGLWGLKALISEFPMVRFWVSVPFRGLWGLKVRSVPSRATHVVVSVPFRGLWGLKGFFDSGDAPWPVRVSVPFRGLWGLKVVKGAIIALGVACFSPLPGFMGSEGATAAGASGATLPLLARHSPCLTHSRTSFAPRQPSRIGRGSSSRIWSLAYAGLRDDVSDALKRRKGNGSALIGGQRSKVGDGTGGSGSRVSLGTRGPGALRQRERRTGKRTGKRGAAFRRRGLRQWRNGGRGRCSGRMGRHYLSGRCRQCIYSGGTYSRARGR